jgi:hypothetical protein
MPLDYSAVEEYHIRLAKGSEVGQGRMWLPEGDEWQVEVTEGEPRTTAAHEMGAEMTPLRLFQRTRDHLEAQAVQMRVCGTCVFFRRSPAEHGEGWLGYCAYRNDNHEAPLGTVALLAPDCHQYQSTTEAQPLIDPDEAPSTARDPNNTRALPSLPKEEKKGLFGSIRNLLGLNKEEPEMVRAGVVERPGGQPCPVCGTRMTNRASIANADKRGEERVLSVWKCPHCAGNFLDDWFEAYVGSKSYDAERLYVVPPIEANVAAAIVVHCPRPDVKGCTCIANQHFDKWGNELEKSGRRIKARESVVSL